MIHRALCTAFLGTILCANPALSYFEAVDPKLMVLESTTPINGMFDFQLWKFPVGKPGSNKYVRPDAPAVVCDKAALGRFRIIDPAMRAITNAADCTAAGGVWTEVPWKTGIIVPHTPPGDGSMKIMTWLDGYNAAPYPVQPSIDGAQPGWVVVKTHPGHYPDVAFYDNALDWWGPARGDANAYRIAAPYRKIFDNLRSSIDWQAGFRLAGSSWGGTGAILQSLLIKDPFARAMVTVVQAHVPETLIVRRDTTPDDGINQNGFYYRDPSIALAWSRPDDVANADIIANSDKVKTIYYAITGNGDDASTFFNKEFFTLFCNDKKIACFGAWRAGNHGQPDPGLVHAPSDRTLAIGQPYFTGEPGAAFSGPDSDARLDKILPVFTDSTQNFISLMPGQPGYVRGHWNLGLEWNSRTQPAPTANRLELPIRYRKHTGFGTGSRFDGVGNLLGPETDPALWIPDQGDSATFTLTLRRTGAFSLPPGKVVHYSLPAQGARPAQTGTATVTVADEITIPGLTLDNGLDYRNLTITPAAATPPG